jgi:tetratricopeptide (TPR) repeat protein
MSADSLSTSSDPEPSPPAESTGAPPTGVEGETGEFPRQKRRHRQMEGGGENTATGGGGLHDQQIMALSSLLASLMEKKGSSEPPAKEVYRFYKGRGTPPAAQPPAAGGGETVSPPPPAAASPPPTPVVAAAAAPAAPAIPAVPVVRDYTRYSDEVDPAPEPPPVVPPPPAAVAVSAPAEAAPTPPPVAATPAAAVALAPVPLAPVPLAPPVGDSAAAAADRPARAKAPLWRKTRDEEPAQGSIPGFVYWALILLVGLAAFIAGRETSSAGLGAPANGSPQSAALPQTVNWREGDLTHLDRILETDQAGDLDGAERLAKALKAQAGPLPGLEAYLGLITARRQRLADAQSTLSRMLSPSLEGSQLAIISSDLAFTYSRERRFTLASQMFKQAALAEPFAAENFRRWGESLRREGHLPQAVAAFQEALARYPVGAVEFMDARQYVEYKIRLSQIEGSLPVDTRTDATDKGATADTNGYWLLTAAAADLQRGNPEAAAADLQQAKAALPAPLFESLLGDYFFRAFASEPQVASFLPTPNPMRSLRRDAVYFIDP